MEITGTYTNGKMFRGNGRWAKVLETKLSTKTLISLAYGIEGKLTAEQCVSCTSRKQAKEEAVDYIESGWISYWSSVRCLSIDDVDHVYT